jgi:hypothetical protein
MGEGLKADCITVGRALACAVIGAGLCGAGLALAGVSSPLRSPLVLLFLATAPTLGMAGLLRDLDLFARIFIACVAMLVIDAGVAETMLAAGLWSPRGGLVAIMTISALLAVVELPAVRRFARRHAAPASTLVNAWVSELAGTFASAAGRRLERM